MATKALKDAVAAHFAALFAGDARVSIKVLRNLVDPTPPKKEAEIDGRAWLFLQFPPTKQERAACGADAPRDEYGAFMVHVAVASNSEEALLDEIAAAVVDSLFSLDADSLFDVDEIFEGDAGPKWGGNFWGVSIGVPFDHRAVGAI